MVVLLFEETQYHQHSVNHSQASSHKIVSYISHPIWETDKTNSPNHYLTDLCWNWKSKTYKNTGKDKGR